MAALLIEKKGLYTSLQDLGHKGKQKFGLAPGGAMDDLSLKIGNLLVGNKPTEVGLEITILGPKLLVLEKCLIAITGGDFALSINGRRCSRWESIQLEKGDSLVFKGVTEGCRGYLAISGGFKLPPEKRAKVLKIGDILDRKTPKLIQEEKRGNVQRKQIFYKVRKDILDKFLTFPDKPRIRVIIRENNIFSNNESAKFLKQDYFISSQSNRMGLKLEGKVALEQDKDLILNSEPVTTGTIQVPPKGQPIILMRDRQTVGGYGVFGEVITADLWKLGQVKPGSKVCFKEANLAEAYEALEEKEAVISRAIVEKKFSFVQLYGQSLYHVDLENTREE